LQNFSIGRYINTHLLLLLLLLSDLGVILDEDVKFRQHMHDKINKAFSMLGVIKRNFKNLTMESFILLYKSMVRSHLEYCNSVWAPHKKNDRFIAELERVQRRATKLVHGLSKLKYSERLKRCGLPTLKYRRHRGDMIETYKILTGVYDCNANPQLQLTTETLEVIQCV
jgi:ribonuclease P/MRP protein subunit RPP40